MEWMLVVLCLSLLSCAKEKTNHLLIHSELSSVELQEKLWEHLENGHEEKAHELKNLMVHTLTSGHCNEQQVDLGGTTRPRILKCDHGIKAIFKVKNIPYPHEESTAETEGLGHQLEEYASYPLSDANAEMAAYSLDVLFDLHIVPLTVIRVIPGLGIGSAQYFIKNAEGGQPHVTSGFRKMKIFDFIISNKDRRENNWLYLSSSNRLIAIDHGQSFFHAPVPTDPVASLPEVVSYLKSEPQFRSKLISVTEQQIYEALSPYLRYPQIQTVQGKIYEIRSALTK